MSGFADLCMFYNILYIKYDLYWYWCLYSGGKVSISSDEYNEILEFRPDTEDWSLAGRMLEARDYHAVSTINFEDVKKYCS